MRIYILFLALFMALFQAGATTLSMNLGYFLANPTINRTVKFQAQSPFSPANPVFVTSDTNGMAYYSNCPNTLINGEIQAPPGKIMFQVQLLATDAGVVDASNRLASGSSTTYPAGQTSWAIATSDQRYQFSGTTLSNTFYPLYSNPSNYVTTNDLPVFFGGYATTNYVNQATNDVSNALSNQIVNATNVNYQVLSQQIIDATNPIPAQITAAATAVTNDPALTRLGTSVYSSLTVTGGEIANTPGANGISGAITVDSQTNGFGTIVDFNSWDYATTGQLANAIAGVPTFAVTNGFVGTGDLANAIAPLATTNYVNTATNGFVTASIITGLATTDYVAAVVAPLATVAYVNTATNGFITASSLGGYATIPYVDTATNSIAISASNTANQLIAATNVQALNTITNAEATLNYYNLINTNQAIAFSGFGNPLVNTIFFTVGNNEYRSATGIRYYFDGSTWFLFQPFVGALYSLGGPNPIGNTYGVVLGPSPAGFSYYTNVSVSASQLAVMTNVAQNIQVGGVVSGVLTNEGFSALGTNIIQSMAGTNGGGGLGTLGGVVGGASTNNSFTLSGTNAILSMVVNPTNGVTASAVSNIVQNATVGGVVNNVLTNEGFSATGSNYMASIALALGGGGSSATNFQLGTAGGVVGGYTTNNNFTATGTNVISGLVSNIVGSVGGFVLISNGYASNLSDTNTLTIINTNVGVGNVVLQADPNANLNLSGGLVLDYENPPATNVLIVPLMTGASAPSGYAATASSTFSSQFPYLAFDRDTSTYWQPSGLTSPQFLEIHIPSPLVAISATITNTQIINGFAVQGSFNGVAWVTIYTNSGSITGGHALTLSNSTPYSYYRGYLAGNDGANVPSITDFQLIAAASATTNAIQITVIPNVGTLNINTGVVMNGNSIINGNLNDNGSIYFTNGAGTDLTVTNPFTLFNPTQTVVSIVGPVSYGGVGYYTHNPNNNIYQSGTNYAYYQASSSNWIFAALSGNFLTNGVAFAYTTNTPASPTNGSVWLVYTNGVPYLPQSSSFALTNTATFWTTNRTVTETAGNYGDQQDTGGLVLNRFPVTTNYIQAIFVIQDGNLTGTYLQSSNSLYFSGILGLSNVVKYVAGTTNWFFTASLAPGTTYFTTNTPQYPPDGSSWPIYLNGSGSPYTTLGVTNKAIFRTLAAYGPVNPVTLSVQSNSYAFGNNTNNGELGVNTGAGFNGTVSAPAGVLGSVRTADAVSTGNIDAQSYTLNGFPLFFGVSVATAYFVTNSPDPWQAFNGIYLLNTTIGVWTNTVSGFQIIPQGNPNAFDQTTIASYGLLSTNYLVYSGSKFYKPGPALVGTWPNFYATPAGVPPPTFPLVSTFTFTNIPGGAVYTNSNIGALASINGSSISTNLTQFQLTNAGALLTSQVAPISISMAVATNGLGFPIEVSGAYPVFTGTNNIYGAPSFTITGVGGTGGGTASNALVMATGGTPLSNSPVVYTGQTNSSGGAYTTNASGNLTFYGTATVSAIVASALTASAIDPITSALNITLGSGQISSGANLMNPGGFFTSAGALTLAGFSGEGHGITNVNAAFVTSAGQPSTNFLATQGITDTNRVTGAFSKISGGTALFTNLSPAHYVAIDTNGNVTASASLMTPSITAIGGGQLNINGNGGTLSSVIVNALNVMSANGIGVTGGHVDGDGRGLTNLPPSAMATASNNMAIVAGTVLITNGLMVATGTTNQWGQPTMTNATSNLVLSGNLAVASIYATSISGNGFSLTNLNDLSINGTSNLLAPTSISFPSTTVNWTNPISGPIEVYINNSGVTLSAIKKNGTSIFSSLATDVTIGLQKGEYFSETYTVGSPSATWSPFP